MIVGYNDEILVCLHLSGMYLYFQLTTANYVYIHCTEVPGKSLPSKSFFVVEKHNEINIYRFLCTLKLRKNKKSHLSPANDIILITDELYDPFVHMFQQVKDYKALNKPFSQLNMIKRKQKLISEVICINHNFSHEFKDDVKWVLYSEHCYRTLGRLVLKLTITQVLVTPKKKTPPELIECSCFWE